MHLTPREQEKLMIFVAAEVARKRRARGLEAELSGSDGDPHRGDSGRGARRQDRGGDHDAGRAAS